MRKGKENRGGARPGSGRKPGPQPHLRNEDARTERLNVSVSRAELEKLCKHYDRTGKPIATRLYELAKRGGL